MAEQAEATFLKKFVGVIVNQPVSYPDDFQAPPEQSLRKIPIVPLLLPDPPKREEVGSTSIDSLSIVIKSLKPLKIYTLAVQSSDTIADIKSYLASQPGAPPVDVQRLLLKGKALADAKLLKEYNIKDGDTVNLMVKPGYDWNQSAEQPKVDIPAPEPEPPAKSPDTLEPGTTRPERHRRVPSVILSPSPNALIPLREGAPVDVALSLDDEDILPPVQAPPTPYQNVISSPHFWGDLLDFLSLRFSSRSDVENGFEEFFGASKRSLTPHQIAKIRDHVGITGMAGV
ncbi:ubiquitin-domain-containing protein [Thelephora ganbajun]|uniref:Ubiquitin-domain-containing protein n=1 Tax=Thelephora ganbajun TaxID=370292 RepID=A0ACB6ZRS1_THEGA|nr:ubiquitin-domain-containing protein [Thelephora ganbajun]